MKYDFETIVKRGQSSLSEAIMMDEIRRVGNVSFDGAEPLYPTAPALRNAVIRMAENGAFSYTIMDQRYQDAVVGWMRDVRGFSIEPDWIVPTLGTIFSVAVAIRLLTVPGESIIVTPPVYYRYEQAATRLDRTTIHCPLTPENGRYHMDFIAIEQAMARPDTKLFVLCNPHNPIGQIWSREELTRLAALADKYNIIVFSDEIFAENSLGGRVCPSYLTIEGAANHCIVATALGKAFGTTGFNHANMLIPNPELREAFADRRTRDHFGSIDPVAYECLLAGYTPEGWDWIQESNHVMTDNMNAVKAFFAEYLPDVPVYGGEGGYILWIDWRKRFANEAELMDFLYYKAYFHVDVGSNYGGPCFTRMSLACPHRCVVAALGTLKAALTEKT